MSRHACWVISKVALDRRLRQLTLGSPPVEAEPSRFTDPYDAGNDRRHGLVTASLALRVRLLEGTEAITDRLGRAEMLSVIARALPN
jgi:hypothetical protein